MATPGADEAPRPDTLLLLVDGGSSDHYFDETINPGLENLMLYVEMLETPRNISTAGNNTLLGTKIGVLLGTVVDEDGRQHNVQITGVIVSTMGRYLFSVKKEVEKGMSTIIDSNLPRLQQGELVLPLQQRHEDSGFLILRVFVGISGQSNYGVCSNDVSLRQRRMGHLNTQSLQILHNPADNGLEYRGTFSPCGTCLVQKTKQRNHPKIANHGIDGLLTLVFTDFIEPISPLAIEGHRHVSMFTYLFAKWKEVYLITSKSEKLWRRYKYVQSLVIPMGLRVQSLRSDRGT